VAGRKLRSKTPANSVAERNRGRADWGAHKARAEGRRVVPGPKGGRVDALPPSADTALKLLEDIKQHRLDPGDLTKQQRQACLLLLANGSQTSVELAALFKVSPSCIRMDLKEIRDERGREVKEWTLSEVLGDVALTAEKCAAQAMKNSDPGLAWTIKRDFAKLMKDFGVIEPSRDESGFRMTIESIGQGYEKARRALTLALDPRLTGEVIDVEASPSTPNLPTLPLRGRTPRLRRRTSTPLSRVLSPAGALAAPPPLSPPPMRSRRSQRPAGPQRSSYIIKRLTISTDRRHMTPKGFPTRWPPLLDLDLSSPHRVSE